MIILVVLVVIALVIVYKVKENKDFKEAQQKKEEEWQRKVKERKKNGEPSVSEELPLGIEYASKGTVTGANGKDYPYSTAYYGTVALHNLSDGEDEEHKQYEYDPAFCMLASEYYITQYLEELGKFDQMNKTTVEYGIKCIYELAESYAYPVPANNDLTHAAYYTARRLADRKRAMEGNGYYKNAYDFPIDFQKALTYYELPETLRVKYEAHLSQVGPGCVARMVKCWLQTAHIYAAGFQDVPQDTTKAKRLYAQAYQMARHLELDDVAVSVIRAMTQGYPRNPEDYQDQAYNMLADWACGSDFGLAMYVEYVLYTNSLDKQRLAKGPQEAVRLCEEQAEKNLYAAYLLGQAFLFGYGTEKDEAKGRKLIEIAAENGCISALYLLTQLSVGDAASEKRWKDALDKAVAAVAEKCGFMREELQREGKSVTRESLEKFRSQFAAEAAAERNFRQAVQKAAHPKSPQSGIDDGDSDTSHHGFVFPRFIYDGDENPWELMNSGSDSAGYYCQKTGETRIFYASDFDYGSPVGFHRR